MLCSFFVLSVIVLSSLVSLIFVWHMLHCLEWDWIGLVGLVLDCVALYCIVCVLCIGVRCCVVLCDVSFLFVCVSSMCVVCVVCGWCYFY